MLRDLATIKRDTMKQDRLFQNIVGLVLIAGLAWLTTYPVQAAGTLRYVSATGADTGACTNPAAPCKTVQYAIDQSVSGDELRLAGGTYGVASISGKSLTLKGGYAADFSSRDPAVNLTTLNGDGFNTVLTAYGQSDAFIDVTLDGLRLVNGGMWGGNSAAGGSTRYVNLTVESCVFQNNSGNSGAAGGLYLMESNAVIRASQFLTNTSTSRGGGIYLYGSRIDRYTLTLEDDLFQGNRGAYGGGIYLWGGMLTLRDNVFVNNTATDVGSQYDAYMVGGGFYIDDSQLLMQRNLIRNNTATQGSGGGGVIAVDRFMVDPGVTQQLENNVFVGNTLGNAARYGAALLFSDAEATLDSNTLSANTGGDGSALTLVEDSVVAVHNSIVANQITGMTVYTDSELTVDGILWYNNTQNTHNIAGSVVLSHEYTGNPNFTADGYHISAGSAALGRAVGVTLADDVDGNVRPQGAVADLGADELLDVGLGVSKQASAAAFYPSSTYVYTITVFNDGVNPASTLTLADDLPPELRATAVNISAGSCVLNTAWDGATTCSVGPLSAGSSAQMLLTVETTATTGGAMLRNVVTATATETQNGATLDTPFHTCQARLNAAPTDYATVQAAIDAATHPTDVVKISGVCAGAQDVDGLRQLAYLDHSVTLQGGWNSDFTACDPALYPTTLNALGLGRVLYVHTGVSATVEGLNITGGDAAGLGGAGLTVNEGAGGGLYAQYSALTVRNAAIYGNYASTAGGEGYGYGGGIAIYNAALTVTNSLIRENVASLNSNGAGGGLYLQQDQLRSSGHYDVVIQDCQILTNTGSVAAHGLGGGVKMTYSYYGDVALTDNLIRGNRAAGGAGEGKGGGFYCSNSINSTATRLAGNQVLYNEAASGAFSGYGGGVYADTCNMALNSNTIQHNRAAYTNHSDYAGYGGGVYVTGGSAYSASEGMFTRNDIAYNAANPLGHGLGGGMYLASSAGIGTPLAPQSALNGERLRFNTAGASGYDSRGGGLFIYLVKPVLRNLLVTDNQATSQGAGIYVSGAKVTVQHATLVHNTGGDGAGIHVAETVIGLDTYTGTLGLYNSIVASQTVGVSVALTNSATLDYVLWHNNTANTGGSGVISSTHTLSGDPRFAADGYHLLGTSPAKDVVEVSPVEEDVDGDFRYGGYGYDLGADEYPAPGFRLRKTANAVSVATGETLTYTIVLSSSGNLTATGTTLVDDIPAAERALSVQTSRGTCAAPGGWGVDVTCDLGALPRLDWASITVTVQATTTTTINPPLALTNIVTATATGEGDGTQRATALTVLLSDCWAKTGDVVYGNVQQAIDTAVPGGLVQISGVCYGVTTIGTLKQVAYITQSLTLEGGWNREFTVQDAALYPTVLDAQTQGRVVYILDTEAVTLTHLILQHGSSLGLGGFQDLSRYHDAGAGMYVNNANVNGRLVVQHCTLRENGVDARSYGGGAYVIRTYNGVVFEDTLIQGNGYYAASNSSSAYNVGGGLAVLYSDGVTLRRSRFIQNASGNDGGLLFSAGSDDGWDTVLENLVFDGNRAYDNYGGLYISSGSQSGDATVRNVAVVNNQVRSGSTPGFYYSPYVAVTSFDHVTIANNTGGNGRGLDFGTGPYGGSYFTVRNLVVVSQTVGVYAGYDIHPTLNGVLWHANTANTGAYTPGEVIVTNARSGAPLFAADGYHLTGPSPALDAGVAATVTTDLDGEARPVGDPLDSPDLGADEFKGLTLTRTVTGTMTFGAARAKVVFDTLPAGLDSITVTVTPGRFPTNRPAEEVVSRTVVIQPAAVIPFTASLALGYAEGELHGLTEANLRLYRWDGGAWQGYADAVDAARNVVTATVVHDCSPWVIGTETTPTAVTLLDFAARRTPLWGYGVIGLVWIMGGSILQRVKKRRKSQFV